MPRPQLQDYPAAFHAYISQTDLPSPTEELLNHFDSTLEFFKTIPSTKYEYAYAPGKWTLKELLQHLIDCERIFCFRAVSIARGEKQSLPGFEEGDYVANSFANSRSWADMCNEFSVVREGSVLLFRSFNQEVLQRSGISNDKPISVNALGFALAGHTKHHLNVINKRYLCP